MNITDTSYILQMHICFYIIMIYNYNILYKLPIVTCFTSLKLFYKLIFSLEKLQDTMEQHLRSKTGGNRELAENALALLAVTYSWYILAMIYSENVFYKFPFPTSLAS